MIKDIVDRQREYFYTGVTLPLENRKKNLIRIKELLYKYRTRFNEAFLLDYNKCEFDVLSTEFYLVLEECDYHIKHLYKETKAKKVRTSIVNFPSKGYLLQEPYGVTLIMAPWNYPLQLALEPLMGAIAAGNTAVIKPASYAANVSKVIYDMFTEMNEPGLISVVLGGRAENQDLLEQRFDYIFFTGGATVGKLVLQKAAEHLTPVSLELGGKSPCIVDKDADIDLAAKRIIWGKFLNAGQTCVAPDHIYVHKDVHDELLQRCLSYVQSYFYHDGKLNDDFPHLINDKHAAKIASFLEPEKTVWGGKMEGRVLEPTILDGVTLSDPCMQEEIFGPIMPILTFDNLDTLLQEVNRREKPLAFYYFSKDKKKAKKVFAISPFGGGCYNDTIMHLTNDDLPFGGVGRSGMGAYHGLASFKTFSHQKSVLSKGKMEINMKYPPYTKKHLNFLKKLSHIKD
ncbi:MAG: aldehyde dehydrogenase family protein [Bacilli bacterium]|jgi:aldehyde dehydrogenase (NAD+)|nr:aldehyde dehydrogenase family protein [Bacilli bacterium]